MDEQLRRKPGADTPYKHLEHGLEVSESWSIMVSSDKRPWDVQRSYPSC